MFPMILCSDIQVLTVASVIQVEANIRKFQQFRVHGHIMYNKDFFKGWIASVVSASSKIELNTIRTSSWAEKAGICSVKSKRYVIGRCRGIPAIYTRLV